MKNLKTIIDENNQSESNFFELATKPETSIQTDVKAKLEKAKELINIYKENAFEFDKNEMVVPYNIVMEAIELILIENGTGEMITESYGYKHLKNCPNCNIELEVSKRSDVYFGNSCTDVVRVHCEKCFYEDAIFSY